MNENQFGSTPAEPNKTVPPPIITKPEPIARGAETLATVGPNIAEKLRPFLACNPLYLMSAALLLYSFYLVSADASFLSGEAAKLGFNLGSLQVYEALLVCTAIFLARRAIWYDSTLLVGLENLLVLVPFILVSQAALIEQRLVWALCGLGLALAAARTGVLKRYIPSLHLPPKAVGIGAVVLAVNAALPVLYRVLHESKFGTKPDWGAAFETNQYVWWLLAPVLCASLLLVSWERGEAALWPQRRWLPLGFVLLWLTGTGVHLYCLGYVYDFDLRREMIAPAVWVLLWVAWLKAAYPRTELMAAWKHAPLALPLLGTLLATPQPGKEVFLTLTTLNAVAFGWIAWHRRTTLAMHLALISGLALIAGMPAEWGQRLTPDFEREKFVWGSAVLYLLVLMAISRDPKAGVVGGILAAIVGGVVAHHSDAPHWAAQVGFVFVLLHSLRWAPSAEAGTTAVRWLAALAWVGHSIGWMQVPGVAWKTSALAVAVLMTCLGYRWFQARWAQWPVALAAVMVLLAAPAQLAVTQVKAAPMGLLAVVGSFMLFGLGTLAAITKHKWTRA